jgi:hypothetical protein
VNFIGCLFPSLQWQFSHYVANCFAHIDIEEQLFANNSAMQAFSATSKAFHRVHRDFAFGGELSNGYWQILSKSSHNMSKGGDSPFFIFWGGGL